ncbi:hypothetical protein GS889_13810 [Rhodococcus hoagii]|nr:hypothetical protein [Prescottella equi]
MAVHPAHRRRAGLARVRVRRAGEVDAVWSRLAEAGHGEVEPFDAPWGQRYATVTDPDGNGVDLFAALPS